jgi:hypothetical protein
MGGACEFQDQAFAGTKPLFGHAETKSDMAVWAYRDRDVPAGKAPQVIAKDGCTLRHRAKTYRNLDAHKVGIGREFAYLCPVLLDSKDGSPLISRE